jgi:cytochrome bd-type quinol oxidase subunit 2
MPKNLKHIISLATLLVILVLPYFVFSASVNPLDKMNHVAGQGGYQPLDATSGPTAMAGIIGTIVQVFLSLLGIIFVILFLYAGYNWMIANGDEGKVSIAQKTMYRAIIGLIITVGSYAIWGFIFSALIINHN